MISFSGILLRLGVAIVLGALVGFERETSEHAAGMRTNALVAFGSCLFTIISAFGFMSLLGISHVQLDPTRIASYIVAGIGFLGGGAIFFQQSHERVKGLTTAAAVWTVAAIGMACGAGLLLEAASATAMALIVLVALRYVERLILPRHAANVHIIHIEATTVAGSFISQLYDVCKRSDLVIEKLDIRSEPNIERVKLACLTHDVAQLAHAVGELHTLPEVTSVNADLDMPRKTLP